MKCVMKLLLKRKHRYLLFVFVYRFGVEGCNNRIKALYWVKNPLIVINNTLASSCCYLIDQLVNSLISMTIRAFYNPVNVL